MSRRDAFLKALAENEDDTTTRLVYADWLDENGEHEEADRQRKWPAAKEWLVRFCREFNLFADEEDPPEQPTSYEELVELGRDAVVDADQEEIWLDCGNNMTLCNALRGNRQDFWKNWSIVTGIHLPPDAAESSYFRCSC
jgi:uncharacterized protein (TIGR02996 family)